MTIATFRRISLGLLTLTVVGLGGWLWQDSMNPAEDPSLGPGARVPASLPVSIVAQALAARDRVHNPQEQASTLSLDCYRDMPSQTTSSGRLLRLRGRLCSGGQARQLHVRNLANGFVATVFISPEASDAFTTDYIHLSPGDNVIEFRDHENSPVAAKMTVAYQTKEIPTNRETTPATAIEDDQD